MYTRETDAFRPNLFALEASVTHPVPGQRVAIAGPLNVRTSALMRMELARALAQGHDDLIVDLSEAEVYDATGLGVLVGAHHAAHRADRRLVVTQSSPRVERLLRVTRLERALSGRVGSVDSRAVLAS